MTSHHSALSYRNHSVAHETLISRFALVSVPLSHEKTLVATFSVVSLRLVTSCVRIRELSWTIMSYSFASTALHAHPISVIHVSAVVSVYLRCEETFLASATLLWRFMHADHLYYTPYVNAGSRVARANSHIMVARKFYSLMGTPMCETFRGSSFSVLGICIVFHSSRCKRIRWSTDTASPFADFCRKCPTVAHET
jgi:hypothetical protein